MSMGDQLADAAFVQGSVHHLVELGYVDPWEVAAQRASEHRELAQRLKVAEAQLESGSVNAAIEGLEAIVAVDGEWVAPRHLLARARFRAGRREAAEAQLVWLEFHGVEHAELSLMRARLSLLRRELSEARDHAVYAKHLHAPLPAADLIIGEINCRQGDLKEAEAAYRSILAANGRHAAALVGLAATALRRGDWEQSIDLSLQAIELEPLLAIAHYRLGVALAMLQRAAEATVALEAVAAMNPLLAAPYRWLARLAAAQGDMQLAARRRRQGAEAMARRRAAHPARPTTAGASGRAFG